MTHPAAADIFLGARLTLPAALGLLIAVTIEDKMIMYFFIVVGLGFFAPDFWLSWAINRRRDKIRLSLPDGLDFLAICLEAGLGLDQAVLRLAQELKLSHPALSEELLQINFEQRASATHDNDFSVSLTKAQIERFPALDEKVLEDKQNFENYEQRYRTTLTSSSSSARKPASTRLSTFQNQVVKDRSSICEPTGRRKAS